MSTRKPPKYKRATEEAHSKLTQLSPLNTNQRRYMTALDTKQQIYAIGASGTGKTYIAAVHAANMYLRRKINKIIISRPNIPVGKDLGFLPGDMREKYEPWAAPVLDVLSEQLGAGVVETALKNGNIELAPLSYMRGRSFNNAMIIVDEAQNLTVHELKMLLTRIGENTQIVIAGDIKQTDLKNTSGLGTVIQLVKKYALDVPVIEFTSEDCVRSGICKMWIEIFDKENL